MDNEQNILAGLKSLDRQVIGEIYDRYFPEIYRYIHYRVGDAVMAEDLASDVFVRLLESTQKGNPPVSNLKGWLIGVASHMIADHFRKKYRRPEEAISEQLPDHAPQPAAEADQREQQRSVQNAYAALTAEQQEVIALRFGQGYTLEETAALMDKNVNAVKALQFRALAALGREMGEVEV